MKRRIPICFACDDNYAPYLAVAIRSIKDNACNDFNYYIHILNSGITEDNKAAILRMADENFMIDFVDVSRKMKRLCAKLHLRDYYSASIYYRIFIPQLFPQYNKAIYLDSDIVVTADISKLFFTDISDSLLGVVADQVVAAIPEFVRYVDVVCNVKADKYFNSGVLLMNLEKMREATIEERFVEIFNEHNFPTVAPDQDYLNVLCRDRVFYLDKGWNKMSVDTDYDGVPPIIHYNMFNKPWQYDGIPYADEFWKYAARTEFYTVLLSGKNNFTEADKEKHRSGGAALIASAIEISESEHTFRRVLFSS